jgi:hypothetical protein
MTGVLDIPIRNGDEGVVVAGMLSQERGSGWNDACAPNRNGRQIECEGSLRAVNNIDGLNRTAE